MSRQSTAPLLDPGSFDFLELVSFVWKAEWEGSFSYTWENFPPIFRSPDLQGHEIDRGKFRRLLDENRSAITKWERSRDATELAEVINSHRTEARRERDNRCQWALRFANGNISCERSEETARWVGNNRSWGYPAVLYRESADQDWRVIEPLGPKNPLDNPLSSSLDSLP